MRLLILGESLDHPDYRGTERTSPYYVSNCTDDHPANKLFLWYVEHAEEGTGPVNDLSKARELIEEYRKLTPPQPFELVEVVTGEGNPESRGELLGFDVSEYLHHSILKNGLIFDPDRYRRACEADERYRAIAPLHRLFYVHFSAQLNEHLLFVDKATADYCCECAAKLIELDPDIFDMPEESLIVAGLYRVD